MNKRSAIIGTGRFIPETIVDNTAFLNQEFFDEASKSLPYENDKIIEKFKAITGIESRRYLKGKLNSSDIATIAAQKAIDDAGINPEQIDQIIMAQNFGDIKEGSNQVDMVPSLAARVKHNLEISNPNCVAYDVVFGCPGWILGMTQADAFIKAGIAKTCLVIGSETLSRVVDPNDRDSMIYSDGAGACVVTEKTDSISGEILSYANQSFTKKEAHYLNYGKTYNPNNQDSNRYIKMLGRKIYEFALINVPNAMKGCLDNSGEKIENLKKIFIHQANEKMDHAIVKRFYKLYGYDDLPEGIMPMSIKKLGNSSVATIPTLYDLVKRNDMKNHAINEGDLVMFASVGAGMHINAITYRV
jgi:3-oxoacyl-[acyl-carrier-protein] synthase-3